MSEIVVVTGLSGAGRRLATDSLEDLGWSTVSNLPPGLASPIVELAQPPGSRIGRVAFSVGAGAHPEDILPIVADLRSFCQVRMVYLEASTETLVRRYKATRRRHPLANDAEHLVAAIDRERELLMPVKAAADIVLDTTDLNVNDLRRRIGELFDTDAGGGVGLTLLSFGYKHGLPLDADLVFDCRLVPNPYYVEDLRPLTGLQQPVRDYVVAQHAAQDLLDELERMLSRLLPQYATGGKARMTVAMGCTGGRHRSVALTEQIASRLRLLGFVPTVFHRDVAK